MKTAISDSKVEPHPLLLVHNGVLPPTPTFFSPDSHPVVRIQPRSWQGSSVHTTAVDSVTFTLPAAASLRPMEDSQEPVDIRVTQQCLLRDNLHSVQSAGPSACSLMMLAVPSVREEVQYLVKAIARNISELRPHSSGHPNPFIPVCFMLPPTTLAS